jgi:hypothetical protein
MMNRPVAITVCRRAVDFAPTPIPPGALFATCTECYAVVVYSPASPHQTLPKVCMQCVGIEPLPFPVMN